MYGLAQCLALQCSLSLPNFVWSLVLIATTAFSIGLSDCTSRLHTFRWLKGATPGFTKQQRAKKKWRTPTQRGTFVWRPLQAFGLVFAGSGGWCHESQPNGNPKTHHWHQNGAPKRTTGTKMEPQNGPPGSPKKGSKTNPWWKTK